MRRLAVLVAALLTLGIAPPAHAAPTRITLCQEQDFPHAANDSAVALCVTYTWQPDGTGINILDQQVRALGTQGCGSRGICLHTGYTYIRNAAGAERWSASGPDLTDAQCSDTCRHTWPYGGDGVIKVNTDHASVRLSGVFYPSGVTARSVDITVRIPADLRGAHRP